MPSLMVARWVGQKSIGPIFRRLYTELSLLCLCGSVRIFQRRFPMDDVLMRSGDIRYQVAKLCEVVPKF